MPVQEGTAPDGAGGINQVKVDREGRSSTRAFIETDQQHGADLGLAWTLCSTYAATGGQEVWSLKNNGDDIHIDMLRISTSASSVVTLFRVTSGTAAGTTIIGRSMKSNEADLSDVTAFGDASVTGSLAGVTIDAQDIGTSVPYDFNANGYVLTKGQEVAITLETTGVVYVAATLHREK